MRERLIELLKSPHKADQLRQMGVDIGKYEDDCIEAMLADFLLANGDIMPPCKIGDTVYAIARKHPCYACKFANDFCHQKCTFVDKTAVKKATVQAFYITNEVEEIHIRFEETKHVHSYYSTFYFKDFGKTVFLTLDEAKKALAERSGE